MAEGCFWPPRRLRRHSSPSGAFGRDSALRLSRQSSSSRQKHLIGYDCVGSRTKTFVIPARVITSSKSRDVSGLMVAVPESQILPYFRGDMEQLVTQSGINRDGGAGAQVCLWQGLPGVRIHPPQLTSHTSCARLPACLFAKRNAGFSHHGSPEFHCACSRVIKRLGGRSRSG